LIDPAEIDESFPQLDLVIDADTCGVTPSTILDLSADEPVVVRQGAGPVEFL
jgi:tRNA A37 threonylcarbamoyladenosine synthetase subunit TsaC/SUA5/YrdC